MVTSLVRAVSGLAVQRGLSHQAGHGQSGRAARNPITPRSGQDPRNESEQQGSSRQWGVKRSHAASGGHVSPVGQRRRRDSKLPGPSVGGAYPPARSPDECQDSSRSKGELSSEEYDVAPLSSAMMDSGTAAVGSGPGRPGKSTSTTVSSLQLSVSPVLGFKRGWGPRVGLGVPTSPAGKASPPWPVGPGPTGMGDSTAVHDLLVGLCSLVQRFDVGSSAGAAPVEAWVPYSLGVGRAVTQVPAVSLPAPGQVQVAGVGIW